MSPKPDRLNQVPSWEFRNRRKSFTPRQLKEKGLFALITEPRTSGVDQARANAFSVAQAVVNALKDIQQQVAA